MIALLVVASLQNSAVIEIPAGFYTPAQLASKISEQGPQVKVGTGLDGRMYVVRWTKRPFSELRSALLGSVGVRFVQTFEGSPWEMQPDATRDLIDDTTFVTYTGAMDSRFRNAMREAQRLGAFTGDPNLIETVSKKLGIEFAPANPRRIQGEESGPQGAGLEAYIADEKNPLATRDGVRLALGALGQRPLSGPLLAQLNAGVRSLIPRDALVMGDLANWQRQGGFASWMVRKGAESAAAEVADARRQRLNPREIQARIADFYLVHRTSFEPRGGVVRFESAMVSPYTGRSWYELQSFEDFGLPMDAASLMSVLPKDERNMGGELKARLERTETDVRGLKGEWKAALGDPSLAQALLSWASQSKTDLVMEWTGQFDAQRTNTGPAAAPSGAVQALSPWLEMNTIERKMTLMSGMFVTTASSDYAAGVFTATYENNLLLMRNEAAGFDRKYPAGLAELAKFRELVRRPFPEFLAACSSVPPSESLWWAQNETSVGGDFVTLLPIFQWLSRTPAKTQEAVVEALRNGTEVQVPLKLASTSALADRLKRVTLASPKLGSETSNYRLFPLHPQFSSYLSSGWLRIEPGQRGYAKVSLIVPGVSPVRTTGGAASPEVAVMRGEFAVTLAAK